MRTAGHVVGGETLGSIEYGVSVLDCPLVIVLGHDSCGAIAAAHPAADGGRVPAGFVRDVVERVTPSVLAAHAAGRNQPEEILAEHIRHTVDLLLERSQVHRGRRSNGAAPAGGADGGRLPPTAAGRAHGRRRRVLPVVVTLEEVTRRSRTSSP